MTNGHRVGSQLITFEPESRNSGIAWSGSNQSGEGQLDGRSKVSCAISLACPFLFSTKGGGRHWFRAACIYGLTYVTYSNHIWTWANSLKTSWEMGNYQKKIPQSDVWFHFPIWFKVGTLIIIRRIWVCCWLTFVLLLARPHPIKEEGSNLVIYSRSIHIYMCIDDDSLEMRYSQLDCVDLSRLYFYVCAIH